MLSSAVHVVVLFSAWQLGWGFDSPKFPKVSVAVMDTLQQYSLCMLLQWPMLVPAWDAEHDVCQVALTKSRAAVRLPVYYLAAMGARMAVGAARLDSWEPAAGMSKQRLAELQTGIYVTKNKKLGKAMTAQLAEAVSTLQQLSKFTAQELENKFGAQYVSDIDEDAQSDDESEKSAAAAGGHAADEEESGASPKQRKTPKRRSGKSSTSAGSPTSAASSRRQRSKPARQSSSAAASTMSSPQKQSSDQGATPWALNAEYCSQSTLSDTPGPFVLGWATTPPTEGIQKITRPQALFPCVVFPPTEASAAAQDEWRATSPDKRKEMLLVLWCLDGTYSVIPTEVWQPWSADEEENLKHAVLTPRGRVGRAALAKAQDEARDAMQQVADKGWLLLDRPAVLDDLFHLVHDAAAGGSSAESRTSSKASTPDPAGARGATTLSRGATAGVKRSRAQRAQERAEAAEASSGAAAAASGSDESSGSDSDPLPQPSRRRGGRAGARAPKQARTGKQIAARASTDDGESSDESDDDVPLSAMGGGSAPPPSTFAVPLPQTGAPFAQWVAALDRAEKHMRQHPPPSPQHTAGAAAAQSVLQGMPLFSRITLAEAKSSGAPGVIKALVTAAAQHPQLRSAAIQARNQWKVVIAQTEKAAAAAAGSSSSGASASTSAPATGAQAQSNQAAAGTPSTAGAVNLTRPSQQAAPTAPPPSAQAPPTNGAAPPSMASEVYAGVACSVRVRCLHRLFSLLKLVLGTFPEQDRLACPIGVIARRLELHIAKAVGAPVSSGVDKRFAQWAYMEQAARVAGLPAVFLHIPDTVEIPTGAVPSSASTCPMASMLPAVEWHEIRSDARTAYVHGMQVLWSAVAQCSAEPVAMGASRPPPPAAAAWAGNARASRMAQVSHNWDDHFPHELSKLRATPPSSLGFGALPPSTEDSLGPHIKYMAEWLPPWVSSTAPPSTILKRPEAPPSTSSQLPALQAVAKRLATAVSLTGGATPPATPSSVG